MKNISTKQTNFFLWLCKNYEMQIYDTLRQIAGKADVSVSTVKHYLTQLNKRGYLTVLNAGSAKQSYILSLEKLQNMNG